MKIFNFFHNKVIFHGLCLIIKNKKIIFVLITLFDVCTVGSTVNQLMEKMISKLIHNDSMIIISYSPVQNS